MIAPREIKRLEEKGVRITWADGVVQEISSIVLRQNCPSAVSKAKRGDESHEKPLTAKKRSLKVIEHTLSEETALKEIWAIGNYAIGIRWGDGHDSGIYSFEMLRSLNL
jgi:ATP-binding protein involved in chromosome partitioning